MPEKLLTIIEVATLLNISEEQVKKMVERGVLPAYKIGGQFLRFRKDQIEALGNGFISNLRNAAASPPKSPAKESRTYTAASYAPAQYSQSFADRVLDFFYFKDFYLVSAVITCTILWFIFKDVLS